MSERKQKNLRLDEEYHNKLENLAEEWFNSKKKQGQVVEKLIDLHSEDDLLGMVKDIHSEVVETKSSEKDTHTQSENTTTEAEEIEEKAKNEEYIDLDAYDLTKIKGKRSINKDLVFYRVAKQQIDTDGFDKSDVRNIVKDKAGYRYNGANEIANSILNQWAVELPNIDQKFSDTVPSYDDIQEFIDDRINVSDYVWSDDTAKKIIEHNVSILKQQSSSSKGNTSKTLVKWYKKQVDYDLDVYNSSDSDGKTGESTIRKIERKAGVKSALRKGVPSNMKKFSSVVVNLDDKLKADIDDIEDAIEDEFKIVEKDGIKYVDRG